MNKSPISARHSVGVPHVKKEMGALVLSLFVHAILVLILALGVAWRPDATQVAVEAELWSALPQIEASAPKESPAVQDKIQNQKEQAMVPAKPQPKAELAIPPVKPRQVPVNDDAAIALKKQRELQKKEAEKKAAEEEKALAKLELKKKQEKEEKANKLKKEKLLAQQKELEDQQKKAEDALEASKNQYLKRLQGQASRTIGSATQKNGVATQASGPSATYAGRVVARVKPNIVYLSSDTQRYTTEVEVWCNSSGKIISRKIVRSSGNVRWDNAVITALDKTEILPKDTDGTVPADMLITFDSSS